jgi:hypothetical protein
MEVSGQFHAPDALPPGKEPPGTQWIGGWLGPRSGLDEVERRKILQLTGLEQRPLAPPSRSYSLYRLCCSGSDCGIITVKYVGVLISLWLFLFPIFLLAAQPKEFFLDGLKKLEQRSHKCVELRGEYVE